MASWSTGRRHPAAPSGDGQDSVPPFSIRPVSFEKDSGDTVGIRECRSLALFVCGHAGSGEDRDLVTMLAGVNAALHDATFCGSAGEQQPLCVQLSEQEVERRVVEPGVACLDQQRLGVERHKRLHPLAGFPGDRTLDEPSPVCRPVAVMVVDEDNGNAIGASPFERQPQSVEPILKGRVQAFSFIMLEVVEHIDHEQHVIHRKLADTR